MAKNKKTPEEKQKDVIKLMLSEISSSYIFISILPNNNIVILEASESLPYTITLDTLLERLYKAKERERMMSETGWFDFPDSNDSNDSL